MKLDTDVLVVEDDDGVFLPYFPAILGAMVGLGEGLLRPGGAEVSVLTARPMPRACLRGEAHTGSLRGFTS